MSDVGDVCVKVLRLDEVIERVGLRRSSIYSYIKQGRFPVPISLGARAVGWLDHEISEWLKLFTTCGRSPVRQGLRSPYITSVSIL